VYPETESALPAYPYKTAPLLFRGLGNTRFELIDQDGGAALSERRAVRGVGFGDLDNDGDIDMVLWNRNEMPSLLRNDLDATDRHWLQLKLEGTKSNRGAFGATVVVEYGGRKQARAVLSQSSFYSADDARVHVGLGAATAARVVVYWPSGAVEEFEAGAVDRVAALKEGSGKRR
jgi:hypothetical protein